MESGGYMNFLQATEYIKSIKAHRGPYQVYKCSDQKLYVMKLSLADGVRITLNEFLAFRLGQLISLPMPRYEIIEISRKLMVGNSHLRKLYRDNIILPGPHIGSVYLSSATKPTDQALKTATNIAKLADMFVFDMWINNRDRHRKNILVIGKSTSRLVFIDHEKSFNGRSWTRKDLIEQCLFPPRWGVHQKDLIRFLARGDLLHQAVGKIRKIPVRQIKRILKDIPEQWRVSTSDKRALIYFLEKRKQILGPLIDGLISKYFP